MTNPSAPSTKVKRYYCLYSNQVNNKTKTYQDGKFPIVPPVVRPSLSANPTPLARDAGFIRHHHLNSRLYLLSADNRPLAESFYRPPRNQPCRFDDAFTLGDDQELEFDEQGFSVQVGELESERNVDLGVIQAQTRTAKNERLAAAKPWALESSSDSNRSAVEQNARAGFSLQHLTTTTTTTTSTIEPHDTTLHRRHGSASNGSSMSVPGWIPAKASTGKAVSSVTAQANNARLTPYSKHLTPTRPSSPLTGLTTADHWVTGVGHTPPTKAARAEFKPPRPSGPPALKRAY